MRPQLTAVNHYDVFPFNHGGSLGIRGLYKGLSEWFDINIVTFVNWDAYPNEVPISKHIKVIPIVKPKKLIELEEAMYKEYGMHSGTLIDYSPSTGRYYAEFPEILEQIKTIAENSLIVLAEHTFTYRIIKKACPGKRLWYRANNVEYDYKLATWDKIGSPADLLQEVFDLEKECCEGREKILTVSQLEVERFIELFGTPREKFINIRSGFDTDNLNIALPSKRTRLSIEHNYSGLFIASNTPVAFAAAMDIADIATSLPDTKFIIMGSVAKGMRNVVLPANVALVGIVPDDVKKYYLQICDFALNLIEGGAGINVKMFEYFAYCLPVITTEYGARGIELTDKKDCIITTKDRYLEDIKFFCQLSPIERDTIANNALALLKDKYCWRSIGKMIAENIKVLYKFNVDENIADLSEIALYSFPSSKSYMPIKSVYIRCAGEYGMKCMEYLVSNGITPMGFIDEDPKKQGTKINGIDVLSPEDYSRHKENSEVIVAVHGFITIAAAALRQGIPLENISIFFGGEKIMRLADLSGDCPYYYCSSKIRDIILNEAKAGEK